MQNGTIIKKVNINMDIKYIDADAIKISVEIGLFILILWVLSHIMPIVSACSFIDTNGTVT